MNIATLGFGALVVLLYVATCASRPLIAFILLEILYLCLGLFPESGFTLAKEAATVLFLACAVFFHHSRAKLFSSTNRKLVSGFILIAAAAALAAVHSPSPVRAVIALRFYVLYPAMLIVPCLLRSQLKRAPRSVQRLLLHLVFLGVVVAAFGLLSSQYRGAVDPRWDTSAQLMQRTSSRGGITDNGVVSVLGNRTNLGAFAALLTLLCVAGAMGRWGIRWWIIGACFILAAALFLSVSRTAYVGLAVGLASMAVQYRRRRWIVLPICVGVVLVAFQVADAHGGGAGQRALMKMEWTLSGRTELWADEFLNAHPANPFGQGLGVFGGSVQGADAEAGRGAVDNSYLLIIAEQGVCGFLAWAALIIAIGCRLRSNTSSLINPLARMVNSTAWSWFWAMLVMAVTVDWLHAVAVMVPVWFLLGLAYVLPDLDWPWMAWTQRRHA